MTPSVTLPSAEPATRKGAPGLDVHRIREDFPILARTVHGKPLVYLDNAASAQRPRAVIDAIRHVYEEEYANVHRGVHLLSQLATQAYEGAREKTRKFINAGSLKEVIFTRGTTESINLVAQTYGRRNISAGDEILITTMEHHSNIVPWQLLCEETGARLRVAPINDHGTILMEDFLKLLGPKTRLVAFPHVSNALGTINPIKALIDHAHARGVPVLVDGAQAVPHVRVDVQALDCDFYAFSAHKMFGPTGVGVLYGKEALLSQMPPWQGGGDMISSVTFEKTTFNELPYKFEAGTPNIAGVIGLGAAIDYMSRIGIDAITDYENDLLAYGTKKLMSVPGLKLIGTAPCKASVLSFVLEGVHPHDVGTVLDQEGIAVRTGHHCAQPVMDRFGIPATTRASLAFYNTREELDYLTEKLHKVIEVFS